MSMLCVVLYLLLLALRREVVKASVLVNAFVLWETEWVWYSLFCQGHTRQKLNAANEWGRFLMSRFGIE